MNTPYEKIAEWFGAPSYRVELGEKQGESHSVELYRLSGDYFWIVKNSDKDVIGYAVASGQMFGDTASNIILPLLHDDPVGAHVNRNLLRDYRLSDVYKYCKKRQPVGPLLRAEYMTLGLCRFGSYSLDTIGFGFLLDFNESFEDTEKIVKEHPDRAVVYGYVIRDGTSKFHQGLFEQIFNLMNERGFESTQLLNHDE